MKFKLNLTFIIGSKNHLSKHWRKYHEFLPRLYYGLADLEAQVIPFDLYFRENLAIQVLRPYRVFRVALFDLLVLVLQELLFHLTNRSFGNLRFIFNQNFLLFQTKCLLCLEDLVDLQVPLDQDC